MNKKLILLGLTTLVISGFILTSQDVFAYKGDPNVKGPYYTQERHEEMEKAFENKDYNAWKTLMSGKGRVTQIVNAENFAKFAEAHKLADEGKIDEARKIRAELGLGLHNGTGTGQGMGYGRTNR